MSARRECVAQRLEAPRQHLVLAGAQAVPGEGRIPYAFTVAELAARIPDGAPPPAVTGAAVVEPLSLNALAATRLLLKLLDGLMPVPTEQ